MLMLTSFLAGLLAFASPAAPVSVSFDTADGGRIVADLYGSGPSGVVLAHGAAFNKESWADLAETLVAKGHQVLAIDFRGYGASRAGKDAKARDQDVLAAVRYLETKGARSVSVVGASMGGGASAQAATEARAGEIDRLFLLSPVAIANPEKIVAKRIMYVASRDEALAPSVKAQFARAPEPKRLELLDGNAHAQNIFPTSQGPRLTELIVEFLAKR
jgi:pimeloyl-ACP methyl ester carboxylesterase